MKFRFVLIAFIASALLGNANAQLKDRERQSTGLNQQTYRLEYIYLI